MAKIKLRKKSAGSPELGKVYRDAVSGFQGVATGRFEYLNGCVRYCLTRQGTAEDDKIKEVVVDEQQMIDVDDVPEVKAEPKRKGGPRDDAQTQR